MPEKFLQTAFLGVRIWIWLYFLFSVINGILIIYFVWKERIKKKYYQIRFPEKLIKVVIHYKSNMFKEYWRIIPDNDILKVEKKYYRYSDIELNSPAKEYIILQDSKTKKYTATIKGKLYTIKMPSIIKKRWRKYPEIHYFFNVPEPINFNASKKDIKLSSSQLEKFNENNLFAKLLAPESKGVMTLMMLFVIIAAIGVVFLVAKNMGWIK